jgi:hypothetical protein
MMLLEKGQLKIVVGLTLFSCYHFYPGLKRLTLSQLA